MFSERNGADNGVVQALYCCFSPGCETSDTLRCKNQGYSLGHVLDLASFVLTRRNFPISALTRVQEKHCGDQECERLVRIFFLVCGVDSARVQRLVDAVEDYVPSSHGGDTAPVNAFAFGGKGLLAAKFPSSPAANKCVLL